MSSLYIHIPFCLSKCPYCSFVSWPGMDRLYQRYVAALLREAAGLRPNASDLPIATLFLGGGTPSLLAAKEVAAIVTGCKELFGFSEQTEISIEANPKTINLEKLTLLRESGINRLSIGVQSFNDRELEFLGRPYSADDAAMAVRLARMAGFDNISLDLMYGLPSQDHHSWQQSLDQALFLAPDHLSLYELTVEQGTPYHRQLEQGLLDLPDEEEIAAMDQITASLCQEGRLAHYEISNYARPGYECRHNINYWQNGPYLALGAGAFSYGEGRRQQRISDPQRYCELIEAGQSVIVEEECLEQAASFRESVIMGLRMNCGVSRARLRRRYNMELGSCYGDTLIRLLDQGLLEMTTDHLRLTSRGRMFANKVMAELV
jgi:oxygen-independent coproporphyrinogen-3 oxidase